MMLQSTLSDPQSSYTHASSHPKSCYTPSQLSVPQSCYTHNSVPIITHKSMTQNLVILTTQLSIMLLHSHLKDPRFYYMNTSVTCIPITLTHTLVAQSCYTHTSVNFKHVTLTHTHPRDSQYFSTHTHISDLLSYYTHTIVTSISVIHQ